MSEQDAIQLLKDYTDKEKKEPITCGFCDTPCGHEHCVTKREGFKKNDKSRTTREHG